MGFKPIPIESIDGKPIIGFVIRPEQYDELIQTVKQELGNSQFLVGQKKEKDRLKVTFLITAKEPAKIRSMSQKLTKIADRFQAKHIQSANISPTEIKFPNQ